MVGILIANAMDPVTGRPSVFFTLLESAAAVAVYFLVVRRHGPTKLHLIQPE